jgi:hypothetical protein
MGLLMDIRAGKRGAGLNLSGNGSLLVTWALAGAALGAFWPPLAALGFIVGLPVGYYAAFGASSTARILRDVGAFLGLAFWCYVYFFSWHFTR